MFINIRHVISFALILLLLGCSKTAGLHTQEEKQRLSRLHSDLAFDFMYNGNLSVAQGEAEEALHLTPRGVEANHAMARVQQLVNDHEKINAYYKSALNTDPYAVLVLNDYGQYLCQQGKVDAALKYFDRASHDLMDPRRMVSYTRAAACSMTRDDSALAQQYLLKALELNPRSTAILLNLIRISYNNNELDKANQYLKRYLVIDKNPSHKVMLLVKDLQADSQL